MIYYFQICINFGQPLSGIIAGKKDVFENITFEKDYAVDIGILLDVIQKGYIVKEVYVGKIENCSQSWHALSEMSKEVIRGILKRANTKFELNSEKTLLKNSKN